MAVIRHLALCGHADVRPEASDGERGNQEWRARDSSVAFFNEACAELLLRVMSDPTTRRY
jgi:hypothetical protein